MDPRREKEISLLPISIGYHVGEIFSDPKLCIIQNEKWEQTGSYKLMFYMAINIEKYDWLVAMGNASLGRQ